ncbi:SDR family oxidoreductase [Natronocalculus amylovorans]|uniref:SDR family oxidoreductase n=1 Tax=Natronocalculus amylovorans TaxID=2917812 RepID=A0AAE3FVX2_9EURY|nr:SDR family oxidoreductase [Natronocalculus amylovorans]MCL9816171.1 SDR family oxidoreductase [Natronocalculus amylovorans]NUE03270.1 SDR family oxidoreductase [Halorubraceae archaeon YAN]
MGSLTDKTILLTGASAGIGEATAHACADDGANIALLARRRERLESIADELETAHGIETLVCPTDVRDDAAIDAAIEETVSTFGQIDVVIANAGLGRGSAVAEMTTEEYRAMMDTNVDGCFFLTRSVIPHLTETAGNLIFVGSFAGKYPRPFNPVYAATKWWVRGFAMSVAGQVGDDNVGVSIVNPSEVRTEFGSEDGTAFEDRFAEGEVTEPEEIADAIVFAASQEHSTVNELDLYRRDKFSGF